MSVFDIVATSFAMNRRQHLAMRLIFPQLFATLLPRPDDLPNIGDVWSYSGTMQEIIKLLEHVQNWKARPVPEERLNEILGATDGT